MNIDYIVGNLIYIFLPCVNIDAIMSTSDRIMQLIYFIVICLNIIWASYCIKKQLDKIESTIDNYENVIRENEIIWSYIENVDTYKSIDDAIRYRDDLINYLQFIDE